MISATELKNGISFEMDGKPYQVVKYAHNKVGRGGATVRVSLRNLKTGNLEEHTYNSTNKFEEIPTQKIETGKGQITSSNHRRKKNTR